MMPAAKMMDPVLGVDIHIIQPPGPVPPIPVPHPFVGMLIDPMDFVPFIGATILVNGMPRAIAGTAGKALPPHIPIGGVFVKPPSNECEMFMGSATVVLDGDPASYMALPALSCQDIGMPAPPRPNPKKKTKMKSLVLPTSVVLPIPAGLPVLIGGPPTISMMALGMKAGMAGLGKLLKKPAKRLKRALKKLKKKAIAKMKPGFIKCKVLRAEPVHILTGEVMVEQRDFALGWRIPLDWTRQYGSQRQRVGLLGRGWETPADARLEFDADSSVVFHDGSVGGAVFPSWPSNGPVAELVAGAVLDVSDDGKGAVVRAKGGLRWHFRMPVAGEHEVPVSHVVDGSGNWLQFVRDGQGNLSEIRDSSGQRVVARMQNGLLVGLALVDPETEKLLPLVRYEYDNRGDLAAVYDALNVPYRFAYDWQRRLERHTDRVGLSFHYEYDEPTAYGRCVHAWGDGGLYDYRFEYLPAIGQVRITDSLGHTSVVDQDEFGLPVRETDPLGGTTAWEYDDAGRCSAQVDAMGRRTEWEFDEAGNLVRMVRPGGTEVTAGHAADGKLTSLTDPNGGQWQYQWDARGLLEQRVSPVGATWKVEHDDRGGVISVIDPLDAVTRYERDRHGRIVARTDPSGEVTSFQVGARDEVLRRTDALGLTQQFSYDAKQRLVRIERSDGGIIECRYDAADNLVSRTDELGRTTRWSHGGLGEIVEQIDADGSVVRYEYDTEEQLLAVINGRGERYTFIRDALGRVLQETDYWGNARRYAYDATGLLLAMTDPLDRRTDYAFDELGRMSTALTSDGDRDDFAYDANGNLIVAVNALARVERAYDADGNMVREVVGDHVVTSEYDMAGNRVSRRVAGGASVAFTFDEAGRFAGLNAGALEMQLEYGSGGRRVAEKVAGGMTRRFDYDVAGRMVAQRVSSRAESMLEQRYDYDPVGNLLSRTDGPVGLVAYQYQYDERDRVRRQVGPSGRVEEFTYDPAGSVLKEVSAPRARGDERAGQSRFARHADRAHEYDAVGNLVRRRSPAGDATFRWNVHNRLVSALNERGQEIRFGYDALGRRIFKDVDGARVDYQWDDDHILSDRSPGGVEEREFIFRPGSFEPLAVLNGQACVYHNDPVGVPLAVLDLDGRELWSATYHAFGDADVTRSLVDNPLRFPGQYFDDETGLSYNLNRYFDPYTGTFVSQDPIGLLGGVDVYRYAPNVWAWLDPFGLHCSGDAVILRRNMNAAGIAEPGYNNSAHHIVMSNSKHPDMVATRTHLKGLDIDINDADNGVFLPRSTAVKDAAGTVASPHSRVHTNAYKAEVKRRITACDDAPAARAELAKIEEELLAGTFPY